MSIFVSFSSSDRDIKDKLVAHLRTALPNETIWESDEGCQSNAFDEFMSEIHRSEIFIVLVSDKAMEPSYVHNEIIEARTCEMAGKLNMLVFKLTDSPYKGNFAANLNHLSDANHVARLKGTEDGFNVLVNRVKSLLEKRRRGEPENPYDTFNPEIKGTELGCGYYVPNSRDNTFIEFDKAFEKSNIIIASQISGYGRKCAVREYALQNKNIKKKIVLHSFSGSMRQFFLNGLEIANVNQEVFKNMSENEVILAKARLLSKLDNSTLIIVPDFVPGIKDDRFVYDALSSLGCRVVFIAQRVPAQLKNIFPVVVVDRLKDEHLTELFFNYYEAAPDEQEELQAPLTEFFDSIDGHTKSVEITANFLADEFGVYPDEVPEILKNIHPNSTNELSERIFELISELFDMKHFGETERAILLAAAYFANTPIDEKLFVEMLKSADMYDAKILRLLIERGWLNNDKTSRTIWIDGFFADVCRAKIDIDEALFVKLLSNLSDSFFYDAALFSLGAMYTTLRRIGSFFELIGLKHLKSACEQINVLYCESEAYLTSIYDAEQCKQQTITAIEQNFTNDEFKSEMAELTDNIFTILASDISIHSPAEQRSNTSITKRLISQSMIGIRAFTDTLYDELDNIADPTFKACIEGFIYAANTANINEFVTAYETAVKMICFGNTGNNINEYIDPFYLLGEHIISCIRSSGYLTLRVCRAWKLLNDTFGIYSYARAYNTLYIYLVTLNNLNIFDSELDEVFEFALQVFDGAKKEGYFKQDDFFTSESNAADSKAIILSLYAKGLTAREDTDEAYKILRQMTEIRPATSASDSRLITACYTLFCELVRVGDTVGAVTMSDDILSQIKVTEDIEASALDVLEEMALFKEAVTEENSANGFEDKCVEYIDYYRRFATEYSNKRLYRKYEETATRAVSTDCSELSKEQLIAMADKLKKRALSGEPKESIAGEAFALVSEAGYRVLGYRHHFVQYIGAAAIADGKIAEIQNGEGKTYTIIASAFLHYLYGRHVYILDTSKYLTKRNFIWMRGVLQYLGCSVQMLSRKGVLSSQNYLNCDIIYSDHEDFAFEYMEDELRSKTLLPSADVVIIDEAEKLLVENGTLPYRLNTTEQISDSAPLAYAVYNTVSAINPGARERYFSADTAAITVKAPLIELLYRECESSGVDISAQNARAERMLRLCIDALFLCNKDKDYFVINDRILKEDKKSGGFVNFSDILTYFLCRKENVPFNTDRLKQQKAANMYTFRELAENFGLLCGATATASGMKKEMENVYGLEVVPIPTNAPVNRTDNPPVIFSEQKTKLLHITELIKEKHKSGQPLLVITDSVYDSNQLSDILKENNVPHQLLNAKNADSQAQLLEDAGVIGSVTVTTALANRGVDIKLGGNAKTMAKRHLAAAGFSESDLENADIADSELYKKLQDLTAYYSKKTEADREKINNLGGLCVIGTSCFDDLRTEQQMRGRCARQGDMGESYVFFSVDDPSFKRLLGTRYQFIKTFIEKQGPQDAYIESTGYLSKIIEKSRENYQHLVYSSLLDAPEMLYRPKAREKVLGLARNLFNEKCNIRALTEKYFFNAPNNISDVLTIAKGGKCSNKAVNTLAKYMNFADISPKKVPSMLKTAVTALHENDLSGMTYDIIAQIIAHQLKFAWSNLINDMEYEVNETRNFYDSERKFQKHIKLYSEELCESLLTSTVSMAMAVKIRKTPPPNNSPKD